MRTAPAGARSSSSTFSSDRAPMAIVTDLKFTLARLRLQLEHGNTR